MMSHDTPPLPEHSDALIGTLVDEKIEIKERIGKGAFGTVYKGRHKLLDIDVAVKVLDRGLFEDEDAQERFKQEARILSTFSHENIVKCYSFATLPDKRACMVLEFLEGKTLAEMLRQDGPWKSQDALPVFEQLCAGLSYAHERGIIHRDLKPENVVICGSAEELKTKILDFGIFKAVDPDAGGRTKTGIALGSVNYMSPEQCKSQKLDIRSDLYSLGCLMYATLVGEPPLQGANDILTMSRHVNETVQSVPAKFQIPKELEAIILKCLEKDADKRFRNAEELKKALQTCPRQFKAEQDGHKVRPALIISVSGAIVIIVAILLFKNSASERGADLNPMRISIKPSLGPRIKNVTNKEELERAESQIEDTIKYHPEIPARDLGRTYNICADYRARHQMEPGPHGQDVLKIVNRQLNKAEELQEKLFLYRVKALLLIVLGMDEESLKTLTVFGQPAAGQEGRRNKEYCSCISEILRILEPGGRTGTEEKVLNEFKNFAEKTGSPTIKALQYFYRAQLYSRKNQSKEAREQALQSARSLSKHMDPSVEFPSFSINSLCEMLVSFGEDAEALKLIKARLDNLSDKSKVVDDPTAKMKLIAAQVCKRQGNYDQSERLATDLLEQCLRDIPDNTISDSVECLILELVHNGKRPHGGTIVGAVKSEAHNYLKDVLKNSPARLSTSISVVMDKMTAVGVNRGWVWEHLEKDLEDAQISEDDKASIRLAHLQFLEEVQDANKESNIQKQAQLILRTLDRVQSKRIKRSCLVALSKIFAKYKDLTAAEYCKSELKKLRGNR